MKKKLVSSTNQVILLLLIFLFISNSAETLEGNDQNNRDDVFYAISSLRFYLEETASEDLSESSNDFEFSDIDVANLWDTASSETPLVTQIKQAKEFYYQAEVENDQIASERLYTKTKSILKSVWKELDSEILKTPKPEKTSLLKNCELLYPNFEKNPLITLKMQKQIRPFLLPLNHPTKKTLDDIFKARAIANQEALAKAGFVTISVRPFTFIIVTRHPELPGYVEKMYLDNEKRKKSGTPGWEWFVKRCVGANNVRTLIKERNLQFFSVPDKWIYPLPPATNAKKGDQKQTVILIATDMNLSTQEECAQAWRNANAQIIEELFIILSHGFASSHLSWNIPYTKGGKFTCIDTEHPKRKPNYAGVKSYLSPEMNEYWKTLVKAGGKLKSGKKKK